MHACCMRPNKTNSHSWNSAQHTKSLQSASGWGTHSYSYEIGELHRNADSDLLSWVADGPCHHDSSHGWEQQRGLSAQFAVQLFPVNGRQGICSLSSETVSFTGGTEKPSFCRYLPSEEDHQLLPVAYILPSGFGKRQSLASGQTFSNKLSRRCEKVWFWLLWVSNNTL